MGVSKMIVSAIVVAAAGVGFAASHSQTLCEGFLPQNTMRIPVGKTGTLRMQWNVTSPANAGGISEKQFNDVMDRVETLFSDDVKRAGGTLKVNRLWKDDTVNASAQELGTSWVLNMYGGLARHKATTIEGMALVACHELGHHLGGAPKIKGWYGDDWATNEGGADYYATLKCLRRYFAQDDNASIVAAAQIDPMVADRCSTQFSNPADQAICMRNSMAAQSVTALFFDLSGDKAMAQFSTPDSKVVSRMDDDHPATQCRMDTYFNGAVCHVDSSVPNSKTDYKEGSCVQGQDQFGWRPLCWFKATDKAPRQQPGQDGQDDDGGWDNHALKVTTVRRSIFW